MTLQSLQAASMDPMMEDLTSLTADLCNKTDRQIVLLRWRRRLLVLEICNLLHAFFGNGYARLGDLHRRLRSVSEDRLTNLGASRDRRAGGGAGARYPAGQPLDCF